jgi:signal transduction histidine kinase
MKATLSEGPPVTFRGKIFLALALVGCAPLVLLGWQTVGVNRAELTRAVGSAQAATARAAASGCEKWIAQSVEQLRLAVGYLPYAQLSAEELAAVLRIPFRQLASAEVLAVLDEGGRALVPPLFATQAATPERDPIGPADLDAFARRVPLTPALAAGTALGPPWRLRGSPRLAVALRVLVSPSRVVAAQLSLAELSRQMRDVAAQGGAAWVATREAEVIAEGGALPHPGPELAAFVAESASGGRHLVRTLRLGSEEWLAAAAPVGDLGWAVVVAQPAAVAFHAADLVGRYTLFWALVALTLTGLLGYALSRGLTEPIARLSAAARAITEGRQSQRVEVSARDEIGQFAEAFNHMSAELLRRDQEIRAWNAELQRRVDERTAELKQAQDQILRSRRLAALGSLGAGIAHELNNPVMGLTGSAALLQRQLGDDPRHQELVRSMAEQARRISQIAAGLRQFAEQERTVAGRPFPLSASVLAALELHGPACEERGIHVETCLPGGLPDVQGDPLQMKEAVAQLVQNAIQAMPHGGELRVALADVAGDAVKLTVSDTGKGIPADIRERIFDPFFSTKQPGQGAGLGLSIAHTIVKAHHGELAVESPEGGGAVFTVVLPAAAAAAHLI